MVVSGIKEGKNGCRQTDRSRRKGWGRGKRMCEEEEKEVGESEEGRKFKGERRSVMGEEKSRSKRRNDERTTTTSKK